MRTEIEDLESGYYWARHNGNGNEWLSQNTSWSPVEVFICSKGSIEESISIYVIGSQTSFDADLFEFGERIVKE